MDFFSANELELQSPAPNEFEVAIFGPGVGECILLHLGKNEWFIIDSCVYPGSKSPIAIEYLEAMEIDPGAAIKRILATHWHDDHVKGISDIVRRCPSATFAMSAALQSDQFFQLVYETDECNKLVAATSTASEFADILDRFAERGRTVPAPDLFVCDGTLLFNGGYNNNVRVQALSPSAATISDSHASLASQLNLDHKAREFTKLGPNNLSVAVQVSAAQFDLLLKADLEHSESDQFGWKAVLSSTVKPNRKSSLVKIGHHGSQNADADGVWQSMVECDPICVVTPYARLREPLPTSADIQRIKTRTNQIYTTTWPPSSKPPRRMGVDGTISGAIRNRRSLSRKPGFARIRFQFCQFDAIEFMPEVELFGSAQRL